MIALRLLGIGNVAAGVASCRSRLVQSVGWVKPVLSLSNGRSAPNRMACRLYGTFRLLSLFFILIMPSIFLADTSDAAWGTTTVDNTSSLNTGEWTSIAVGTSGAAHISYSDVTNGYLMYATNVTGSWGTTTVDNTAFTGGYTSIAVGTSGAVYISYYNSTNSALMYATNVSGSWGTSTLDSAGDVGQFTSIAVGTSGAAYISYYANAGALKYATNVSGSWGTTTLDSATAGTGKWTSIAVGTSGAAYISYCDDTNRDLKYATNVSGSWGTTTVDNTSSSDTGQYSSIAVGTSGAVYISYYNSPTDDLMYATNVTGLWGTTTVDSAVVGGLYTSIAVGTSGAVYISYQDNANGDLKYATNVSGSWGTTTLDSTGNTGRYTSIEVDTSGAVYISYYDVTRTALMYATNFIPPTVTTGAASGVTTSSATLGGTVNANGWSTTAMFSYGAASGSYTGTSTTQSVSGESDTAVSIGISSLSSGTTYYYRIAANNAAGTSTGSEASFSTSSSGGGGEPPPTRITLTVTSTSPSSGATGVGTNTVVTATFSDNMNGSTLTTDTFKLSSGGSSVTGSVSTNGNKATFTPSSSLTYDTTYTATITTGAQAANFAGTTLDSNYSWSFTTASAPIVPTPTATPSPTPVTTPTAVSTATPTPVSSPTPTITPTQPAGLSLSKEVAYLSGDTVAVAVVDADRNSNAASEDTLTTALKVTALNYFAGGDLTLDMKENAVNSGTFLATIKTGTTTIGGASSSTRSNIGTIKTVQGGTATVIYTDTTPNTSTITKTLSFSSSDATMKFDAESYTVGSYAVITHVDAEENSDNTKEDTLLNHAVIETSSINRAWLSLVETGADTGTFKGSILVIQSCILT